MTEYVAIVCRFYRACFYGLVLFSLQINLYKGRVGVKKVLKQTWII